MWVVFVITVVVLIAWLAWNYLDLVRVKRALVSAWSDLSARLEERHEFARSLLEEFGKRLSGGSEAGQKLRAATDEAAAAGKQPGGERAAAEDRLSAAIGLFLHELETDESLLEHEPYVKAREKSFEIEDDITLKRTAYNSFVLRYNVQQSVFPASVFAGKLGMKAEPEFEMEDAFAHYTLKVKATLPTKRTTFPGLEEPKAEAEK